MTERQVDADAARARGLTVVDLSDAWAPPCSSGASYRIGVHVGLAADRGDGDGQPLAAGERNYLELYGIPPALSVLRRRFLIDAAGALRARVRRGRRCSPSIEIRTWGASTEQKELAKHRRARHGCEAARAAARRRRPGRRSPRAATRARPATRRSTCASRRSGSRSREVEKRLACEGLMDARKHKPGAYDTEMRTAMLDFQQKHAVMDQADIKRATLEALARPPLENDFLALARVLTERAMHAGRLHRGRQRRRVDLRIRRIRPTSARTARATASPTSRRRRRDATLNALGIATPDDAVAFFRRHPRDDFRWLKVAVRLPPPPEYYSRAMDLSVEIDRGDVWYDFPFDAAGVRQPQPRERFPQLHAVRQVARRARAARALADDRRRLARPSWPATGRSTTATRAPTSARASGATSSPRRSGSRRASSPLGVDGEGEARRRAPTCASPTTTRRAPAICPPTAWSPRSTRRCASGPDGARFFDNGIRTHGSFDYLSLRGRFSHGCHRLYNQLGDAPVQLRARAPQARASPGRWPLGYRRAFYSRGEVFEMRLPSRGFYRELDPPMPVDVLEGRIKGTLTKPIAGYVPKPGVKYASRRPPAASDTPEDKAGGDAP